MAEQTQAVSVFGNPTVEYHRNKRRQPTGVLVGTKINGQVHIGYSKCCKTDNFSKKTGKLLAQARLAKSIEGRDVIQHIPHSMLRHAEQFRDRCEAHM